MKKFSFLMAFVAIIAAFTGCDKDNDATITSEDSSSYTLEGYIYDVDGNTPMDSAVVTGSFGSTYTDENGYFEISGLNHGSYTVIYSADGYGSMSFTYDLTVDGDNPLVVDYTESVEVDMYKYDQSLETTVWGTLNNKTFALAGATYTITLDDSFLDNVVEGTTGEDGSISLSGALPNAYLTLEIEYTDSETGYTYSDSYYVRPSKIDANLYIEGELVSTDFFLEDSNIFDEDGNEVEDFGTTSALTFTFNNTVSSVEDVYLYNSTDSREIAVEASISGTTVTISPVGDLDAGDKYYVYFTANDEDGNSVSPEYYFYTEGEEVTSLSSPVLSLNEDYVISETTTRVYLTFSSVDNADSYEVYAKYSSQTEYKKITSYSLYESDDVEYFSFNMSNLKDVDQPEAGWFSDGNTLTVIAKAINDNGVESDFSSPLTITVAE